MVDDLNHPDIEKRPAPHLLLPGTGGVIPPGMEHLLDLGRSLCIVLPKCQDVLEYQ